MMIIGRAYCPSESFRQLLEEVANDSIKKPIFDTRGVLQVILYGSASVNGQSWSYQNSSK